MRILEDRANSYGELLFATATLPDTLWSLANALAQAPHFLYFFCGLFTAIETVRFTDDAAARTYSTVRPTQFFEVFAGHVFIDKLRLQQGTFLFLSRRFHGED